MAEKSETKKEEVKPLSLEYQYYLLKSNINSAKDHLSYLDNELYEQGKKIQELNRKLEELKKQIKKRTMEEIANEYDWNGQIGRIVGENPENVNLEFKKDGTGQVWLYGIGKIDVGYIRMDHNLGEFYNTKNERNCILIYYLFPN